MESPLRKSQAGMKSSKIQCYSSSSIRISFICSHCQMQSSLSYWTAGIKPQSYSFSDGQKDKFLTMNRKMWRGVLLQPHWAHDTSHTKRSHIVPCRKVIIAPESQSHLELCLKIYDRLHTLGKTIRAPPSPLVSCFCLYLERDFFSGQTRSLSL